MTQKPDDDLIARMERAEFECKQEIWFQQLLKEPNESTLEKLNIILSTLSDLLDLLKSPESKAKEALDIVEKRIKDGFNTYGASAYGGCVSHKEYETIRAALLSLSATQGKLLVHIVHVHSGETWEYRITPNEIDETGITIECGAFDEQKYVIRIMKEPKHE